MVLVIIIFGLPGVFVLIDFLGFLLGKRGNNRAIFRIVEFICMILYPVLGIMFYGDKNDCCSESSIFSPNHVLTIYILIIACLLAYFYSSYRKIIAKDLNIVRNTPIVEVVINSLLLACIILNIFIGIQVAEFAMALAANVPIILLTIMALYKNQRLLIQHSQETQFVPSNKLERIAWQILNLKPLLKFTLLFVLCLPLLAMLTAVLLLVGQKPDSLIRAFTDTYKHGFSQLNYECENVQCGGHYLCSVAANGHKKVVKPQRLCVRLNKPIICNRQLLVSNAFEDLIQEKLPYAHKLLRTHYNKVGNLVHRYYSIFNNKFVSDFIYLLMKPLEWFFVLTLYTFDRNPENRIAKQYLSSADRLRIDTR